MNMLLREDTTVSNLTCILIQVSVAHAKGISESYLIFMLSSKILTTWKMLLLLSGYRYVMENGDYSCFFRLNVNTDLAGRCKDNFTIILYNYVVQ